MRKIRSQSEYGKKLNNEGMTLVEILAAIIILSVVSIVFLRSFTYAFKVNEQAKEKQYSMILAQSMMESIKAYDLDSLDKQFSDPAEPFRVYQGDSGAKSMVMTTSPSGDITRQYTVQDVVYQQAGLGDRYKFNVDIEVKPRPGYKEVLASAQDINPYGDAVYVAQPNEQDDLINDIKTGLANQGHTGTITTLDTSKITATRTLKVDITSDAKVTVQAVYNYSVNNYGITRADGTTGTASFSGTVNVPDTPSPCYDKSLLGGDAIALKNLYLYYFPAYKDSMNGQIGCTDKIEISNNCNDLTQVYLVKQKNVAFSETEIDVLENNYTPQVSCASPTKLTLWHNLKTNLNTGSTLYPTISGNIEEIGDGTPWAEDVEETVLLYDVTITVQRAGNTVCELVGSTNVK